MVQSARTRGPEQLAEAADVYLALGRIIRLLRRSGDFGSLSPGAAAALATLVRGGPMRLGDLAVAERVTAPTMSRIVAALERVGHIERTPDPADGRAQLLVATGAGRDLVNGLTSARIERFAAALDGIAPGDRTVLAHSLIRLVDLLDEQWD
ncbi:MAG: MarR family transcriptional regulator [Mycobacteriaceae bacterium]|nr:MarR family transcriptional regulator [Mycobacteriaceae bacterium]